MELTVFDGNSFCVNKLAYEKPVYGISVPYGKFPLVSGLDCCLLGNILVSNDPPYHICSNHSTPIEICLHMMAHFGRMGIVYHLLLDR